MDSEQYRYRKKRRLKHQLVWFSLLLFYFKLCFSLLFWLYEELSFVEHTSIGVDTIAELVLLVIGLIASGWLTHLLAGPLELKQLD